MITPVYPAGRPAPEGHYAPAVVHGGLVHVSGTLPESPGHEAANAPFEAQMNTLLKHCDDVLRAAGSSPEKVISLTLYLTNLETWDAANRALAQFFGAHRPARSVICVPEIRQGYAVQAMLIAAVQPFLLD